MVLDSPFCLINITNSVKFPFRIFYYCEVGIWWNLSEQGSQRIWDLPPRLSGSKVIRSGENIVIYIIEWDNYLCKINYACIIYSAFVHVNNRVCTSVLLCVCVCVKIGY